MGELIDSSVLIALERRERSVGWLQAQFPDVSYAVAAITASELLVGVYLGRPVERRVRREAFFEEIVRRVPVLPFDLRVARLHAEISAQLRAAGQLIGAHDLLIAATALAHGYAVVTANLREFERVPGLVVRRFP